MLFAPIGPARLLRRIREEHGDNILGYYHLCLAHDIVDHQKEWENVFPPYSTIIIDNGIIELGHPVQWEVMKAAVDILGSNIYQRVVVLPDRFDDPETTYLGSRHYYNQIKDKLPENVEFMYVLQGRSLADIGSAITGGLALHAEGERPIDWWGIPRRIVHNMGTRLYAVLRARETQLTEIPNLKIHLLGFSNNIEDDLFCTREQGVLGIDSTLPLRLGQHKKLIKFDFLGDQAGPRSEDDFWEAPHNTVEHETLYNLTRIRDYIRLQIFEEDYRPTLIHQR
jgi:hypothetical protein